MGKVVKLINGELINRDQVMSKHSGLVHKECNRLKTWAESYGHDYDDIYQVGSMGLIKSFDRFDFDKFPVRFSTYAIPMISGEITRLIRDSSKGVKYPRSVKELGWAIKKAKLEEKSAEGIAVALGFRVDQVIDALDFLLNETPTGIDKKFASSDEKGLTIVDVMGKNDDTTGIYVEEFINSLPEREQMIVRGLLNGDTQTAISKVAGVSQVQVSRIAKKIGFKYLDYSQEEQLKEVQGGHCLGLALSAMFLILERETPKLKRGKEIATNEKVSSR